MQQKRTAQAINLMQQLYKAPALRFAFVGGINTLIDLGIFSLLLYLYHWPLLAAHSVGFSVAVLNSYLMNKLWTFQDSSIGRESLRQAGLFFLVALGGLAVSSVVITLADLVMYSLLAKIVATGASFLWNYLLSKRFVFTS